MRNLFLLNLGGILRIPAIMLKFEVDIKEVNKLSK